MTERTDVFSGEAAVDNPFYEALLEDDPEELYDSAPCAYLSTLPDGTIVKVNRTFLAWTGHRATELVGRRRFSELLAPGDRIFYETHFVPLLHMQGQVREIAVQVVGEDGARLPVLLNAVLKRDASGAPVVVRTAIFDATERRAYEAELVAARQRAEQSEARARALARTLQATFLPPAIPPVPGLDVGGAYRPAGDGSEVGGDFYDVFETGRGTWAIVLGDVCGKGPEAAVVTALARHSVRAEALRTPYPSAVLACLHNALVLHHPDRFCTAVLGVVERAPEGMRLTVSSGGHHLPIRVGADGSIDALGEPGTILGMLDTPRLGDSSTVLRPGDVVVLYTDGITEARHRGEFFDDDRLMDLVRESAGLPAQDIADSIVASAVAYQGGIARDDIAVVVVRAP
ncbi:MAG: PP2C family protein-serine/threonine phosphatase [Acidimicrobiia bacterium]